MMLKGRGDVARVRRMPDAIGLARAVRRVEKIAIILIARFACLPVYYFYRVFAHCAAAERSGAAVGFDGRRRRKQKIVMVTTTMLNAEEEKRGPRSLSEVLVFGREDLPGCGSHIFIKKSTVVGEVPQRVHFAG